MWLYSFFFFFFQAEDGIRDVAVTGVQTYALPILFSEKGELKVQAPSLRAEGMVEEASRKAGESGYLSKADREVLALALDLKLDGHEPVIVSDDYAIQNLAEHLQIGHSSLANYGIVHRFDWIMYCPACYRRYKPPAKKCRVCGTELRRKVLSKKKATRR